MTPRNGKTEFLPIQFELKFPSTVLHLGRHHVCRRFNTNTHQLTLIQFVGHAAAALFRNDNQTAWPDRPQQFQFFSHNSFNRTESTKVCSAQPGQDRRRWLHESRKRANFAASRCRYFENSVRLLPTQTEQAQRYSHVIIEIFRTLVCTTNRRQYLVNHLASRCFRETPGHCNSSGRTPISIPRSEFPEGAQGVFHSHTHQVRTPSTPGTNNRDLCSPPRSVRKKLTPVMLLPRQSDEQVAVLHPTRIGHNSTHRSRFPEFRPSNDDTRHNLLQLIQSNGIHFVTPPSLSTPNCIESLMPCNVARTTSRSSNRNSFPPISW